MFVEHNFVQEKPLQNRRSLPFFLQQVRRPEQVVHSTTTPSSCEKRRSKGIILGMSVIGGRAPEPIIRYSYAGPIIDDQGPTHRMRP